MMPEDTIIESDLTLDKQYKLVCKELDEGKHDKVYPICFSMGHNHTISLKDCSIVKRSDPLIETMDKTIIGIRIIKLFDLLDKKSQKEMIKNLSVEL